MVRNGFQPFRQYFDTHTHTLECPCTVPDTCKAHALGPQAFGRATLCNFACVCCFLGVAGFLPSFFFNTKQRKRLKKAAFRFVSLKHHQKKVPSQKPDTPPCLLVSLFVDDCFPLTPGWAWGRMEPPGDHRFPCFHLPGSFGVPIFDPQPGGHAAAAGRGRHVPAAVRLRHRGRGARARHAHGRLTAIG